MKTSTLNTFDYPTNSTHNYKPYKEEQKLNKKQHQKQKCLEHKQQSNYQERQHAKTQQIKKNKQQELQYKKRLMQELESKKRQLEELEEVKQNAIEQEKRSYELAILKQKQDQLKKEHQKKKLKQYDENANERFQMALLRLQTEKTQKEEKQRKAEHLRRVRQENEIRERQKAIKYQRHREERDRQKAQEQFKYQEECKSIGKTTNFRGKDYSKTHMHNPLIISPTKFSGYNALVRAEQQQYRRQQQSRNKQQEEQKNRQKSMQRGKSAEQQLKDNKQYEKYCKEEEKKAKNYNIERINAGKNNQYTGVKPNTLQQMQTNKNKRSEQQFESIFRPKNSPTHMVRQYQVIERRNNFQKQQEEINDSFEKKTVNQKKSNKFKQKVHNMSDEIENHSSEMMEAAVESEDKPIADTNYMETRCVKDQDDREQYMTEGLKQQQLSYSDSQDSSMMANL